ncbi:DNA-binding protein [Pseudomonas sp. DWP1b1]|uniref:DNA-binding protein n=1 Tax=unclassified Pseudomonas TaxID=196821 RepID=UPI003CF3C304
MAIGVPDHDVFAAADAVLARGERPTVERVRLELGRGSPARVGGLLDQWWASLAERLSSETRLPTLPEEVSQAFVAVWLQATHPVHGAAEQALSEQRLFLAAERERVAVVEDQTLQDIALARQHAMAAQAAQEISETRMADLEVLLEQRAAQIQDLLQQRDSLLRERSDAQQHSHTLHQGLQELRFKAEQERVALEIYVHAVENRAHREVDRAREERKRMTVQVKEAGSQLEQLQQRIEGVQAALGHALQNAAAQQARGDTLEQQLVHLRSSPVSERKTRVRKKPEPSQ